MKRVVEDFAVGGSFGATRQLGRLVTDNRKQQEPGSGEQPNVQFPINVYTNEAGGATVVMDDNHPVLWLFPT